MKAVCSTNSLHLFESLIQSICYLQESSFKNKATTWGCQHERVAKETFVTAMCSVHDDATFIDNGRYMDPDYPFLGASPDGIVTYKCCGEACLEVKCPYNCKDKVLTDKHSKHFCMKDDPTLPESQRLKRNHAYYYELQTQLFVTKRILLFLLY